MQYLIVILVAGLAFGGCYLADKLFTKAFRGQKEHRSGKAVKLAKRNGVVGVILAALGLAAVVSGTQGQPLLLWGGALIAAVGLGLCVYYLSFGIFYDGAGFLLARFAQKDRRYAYRDIRHQQLYVVQGGSVIVELHMADGSAVQVQSTMEGAYPFLDFAYSRWLEQTGREAESCAFHDPGNCCWFPSEEDA